MSSTESRTGDAHPDPAPPRDGKNGSKPEREETSGLHDIRALARSELQRRSAAREAVDAADMLENSSPLSLGQVVLPKPGREVAPVVVPVEAGGPRAEPKRTSAAGVALILGLLLVGAAAAAFFWMKSREGDRAAGEQTQVAQAEGMPAAAQPTDEASAGVGEGAPAVPAEVPPATAAGAATDVGATPEAAAAAASGASSKTAGETTRATAATDKATTDKATGKATADQAAADKAAADKAAASKAATTTAKAGTPAGETASPAAAQAGPSGSLDSLIDEAVGLDPSVAKAATAAPVEDKPEPAAPAAPDQLSREDIKQGMRTVHARVQACYDKFKVPGTIKVRVKIDPDGSVASADAVDDKFKSTETGFCVSEAVKTAKFRTFSGSAMIIGGYPFKLQ